MTQPKLASAVGEARGYKQIFGDGTIVPSVTTALKSVGDPGGLIYWSVEQTVLYAITHIDDLLNRTEEAGMRYLQYVSSKPKKELLEDPDLNPYNVHRVVLDDLANTGDFIHAYVEADLQGLFPEEPYRQDQADMVGAYLEWKSQHDVEMLATEATVFGQGYAGTGDFWAVIDGVRYLVDTKSSRKIGNSHIAQLAALGACDTMAVEVAEGTPGAVYHKLAPKIAEAHGGQVDSWWVPEPTPDFTAYGVLQIRPADFDRQTGALIDPFCELHTISQERIDAGFRLFQAGVMAHHAERELKSAGT